MTDTKMLRSAMALHGHSSKSLAKKVGINSATFSNKLTGKAEWKGNEISIIKDELSLEPDQLVGIFFS